MLSGRWPAVHSEELKRGITIKLGYADTTIYKCDKCGGFCSAETCPKCFVAAVPQRTVSFVDAPGHETLMATVLAGAALMDGVLLVIAANERCPQPQTREHLAVLDIVGIRNIVIVQNKIDLVSREAAIENHKQICNFIKGTVADGAPIIPVSAQQRIGSAALLAAIQEQLPTPKREPGRPPRMLVVRSFDVNKPGTAIQNLRGGVLGGALIHGRLRIGDELEIKPGLRTKGMWAPLRTRVISLHKAGKPLPEAGPGGLLGVLTGLDPALTKADALAGSLAGAELPPTRDTLSLEISLLERLLDKKIEPVKPREVLMVNVGTARTIGTVRTIKRGIADLELKLPVCCEAGAKAVLSRRIADRWRIIGIGIVK
jgi:translation initiation factor 2 subunit 3